MKLARILLALASLLIAALAAAQDDAAFVSRSGSTGVYAGSDFYCINTMKNTGTTTWTTAAGYAMMSINPANNTTWGGNRIPIPASVTSVAPNAQVTFTKLCTAPITPGIYAMQWQSSKGGAAFGAPTPALNITVYAAPDNAQHLSSTAVSTSIGPGVKFGVTLTMKNLGTASWTSGYALVPIGSNNFGITSLAAAPTAPNASYGFTGTFTAPTTPGTYSFQWRMQHGTTKFGQSTPLVNIAVSADAAQFISRSGTTEVFTGLNFYATNVMKNTGTTTWTWSSTPTFWMSIIPGSDTTWSASKMNLPMTIAPGATMTTSALCKAPAIPGTYMMQWQMVKNGVPFGEKTPLTQIKIDARPPLAAQCTAQSVPTTATAGQHFIATFTFTNVGTGQWPANTVLTSPTINSWALTDTPVGATIAPNGSKSFTIDAVAPYTPGTYTFQLRLKDPSTSQYFGYASNAVSMNVSASQYAQSPWPGFRGGRNRQTGRGYGSGATNHVQWTYQANWYPLYAPVIGADGTIYCNTTTSQCFALSSTGVLKWSFTPAQMIGSPALASDGTLYVCGFSGTIYAINSANAAVKWSVSTGAQIYGCPTVGPNGTVYVGLYNQKLIALDGATGAEKWEVPDPSGFGAAVAIGDDGTVYAASESGVLYALDPINGATKWKYIGGTGGSTRRAPAIGPDGTVYYGSQNLIAVDGKTGVFKWSNTLEGGVNQDSPSISKDGTVIIPGVNDLLAFDGVSGALKWKVITGGFIESTPAIASDGTVYFVSEDMHLYAVDGSTGAIKWTYAGTSPCYGSPAIGADGTVYVGFDDRRLYAFK